MPNRFDLLRPETIQVLSDSGWDPQRKMDVSRWMEVFRQEGYAPSLRAEEVLSTLGGLSVEPVNKTGPYFSNDEPFSFDPISCGNQRGMALEIEQALGGRYFPIGEWLSYSSVFMEDGGAVVAAGLGWIWSMGSSFEEALELAIYADRPLECLYTDPGLNPWPR
ncbi:SUKH-3 domain-containing protein [Streptomyces sp. NPDC059917]|uniref:SUKH-3 domain-containing protein n=1 Tax=Streptomyces sp. NPDC059917 TaxID=3347002 RepID=UPI003651BCC9